MRVVTARADYAQVATVSAFLAVGLSDFKNPTHGFTVMEILPDQHGHMPTA